MEGRGEGDRQKSRVKADEGCRGGKGVGGVGGVTGCQDADDFCTSFFMRFCGFFCSIAVNCERETERGRGREREGL